MLLGSVAAERRVVVASHVQFGVMYACPRQVMTIEEVIVDV